MPRRYTADIDTDDQKIIAATRRKVLDAQNRRKKNQPPEPGRIQFLFSLY